MNETKPIDSIEWTVATDEFSEWVVEMGNLWSIRTNAGWEFVMGLKNKIDEQPNKQAVSKVYDAIDNQTTAGRKRLQNLVSLARNPSSVTARNLGLDIAHAEAVQGCEEEEAHALLLEAAEQSLHPAALGAILRSKRVASVKIADVPVDGNQADDELSDNNIHDVPFDNSKSNILYENADDYSAEADAYAGDAAGYEYIDESDSYQYTGKEFAQRMMTGAKRLHELAELQVGWQRQRTQREWIMKLEELIY